MNDWFQKLADNLRPQFSDEPQRLLAKREYRAAVISAITLFETTLLESLSTLDVLFAKERRHPLSFYQMLETAARHELITSSELRKLRDWMVVRNRLVHTRISIRASQARKIVHGIMRIISGVKQRMGLSAPDSS